MTVQKWLGKNNQLGIDIWTKKYQQNNETFDDDDIETKAKQLTDNKVILHQEKVKTLIETLSVKVKKTDSQEENKKSDNKTVDNKNTEGSND